MSVGADRGECACPLFLHLDRLQDTTHLPTAQNHACGTTRDELLELIKYHYGRLLDFNLDYFCYGQIAYSPRVYARARLRRIAACLDGASVRAAKVAVVR